MVCPKCGQRNSYAVDSREVAGVRRRRYECEDCGARWTTREISDAEYRALREQARVLKKIQKAAELVV